MARMTPTWVYVITCGEHVKIGIATSVETRLRGLQGNNPYPVAVFGTRLFDDYSFARKVEMDLHRRFADTRGFGEWFRIEPEAALEALNRWSEAECQEPIKKRPGWTDADLRMVNALKF